MERTYTSATEGGICLISTAHGMSNLQTRTDQEILCLLAWRKEQPEGEEYWACRPNCIMHCLLHSMPFGKNSMKRRWECYCAAAPVLWPCCMNCRSQDMVMTGPQIHPASKKNTGDTERQDGETIKKR